MFPEYPPTKEKTSTCIPESYEADTGPYEADTEPYEADTEPYEADRKHSAHHNMACSYSHVDQTGLADRCGADTSH